MGMDGWRPRVSFGVGSEGGGGMGGGWKKGSEV